ncbi:MAG: uroporphyrinogen-III synthase [Owenweeksia sp.]|nr:uroporphyrinogen-III synthase [Owenweeksia sp.]
MPDDSGKPFVFSTRSLKPELTSRLQNAGIHYQEQDFIQVSHDFDGDSFLYKLNNPATQARVFTSKNAVFSLRKLARKNRLQLEPKKIFTVGIRATEMLTEEFGLKTAARAKNAISLAQIIARNKDVQAVEFFCGNQSLNDLPEYLESKGINVHKEVVYKTDLVHDQVNTSSIDGLIFLSPTAVYSFFKKNKINPHIPAFCIGATTSEAVHLRCTNPRIESDEPSIESVVEKVVEHFEIWKSLEDEKI